MKLRLRNPFESRPSLVRAPLPGFDPIYYLFWYPDVRAAGLEPLHHYLYHGWKEGRDPSAGFSTSGYLAANPDVVASGQNPLVHFVNAGFAEGREGFQKDPEAPAPKPTSTSAPPKLLPAPMVRNDAPQRGHIDFVDHTHIYGWAIGLESALKSTEVQIIVDDAIVGIATANVFRNDLRELNIGSGHHAFSFVFRPPLREDTNYTVIVRRSSDGSEIGRRVIQADS